MIRVLSSTKQLLRNKLAVGGVIAATTAAVSVAGIAGAAPMTHSVSTPDIVKMCKSAAFRQAHHFKNVGDCVSTMQHQMGNGQGHGYGNNNTVNATVNINSNNGVINIIENFFF